MARRSTSSSGWYVCSETFHGEDEAGGPLIGRKDVTRVRAGHPLLKRYAAYFEPLEADASETYDVEDTSAEPGVKRGERHTAA